MNKRKKCNKHCGYMQRSKECENKIIDYYLKKELSPPQISEQCHCSQYYARQVLKKHDIPIGLNMNKHRTYNCAERYFKNIDTNEKAYWLGFLYADGNISINSALVQVDLQKQDARHLKKFKQAVKSEHPITYHINNGGHEYAHFNINSYKMKYDLINLGCMPNKSQILKFPTEQQVPRKFIFHFLRGYFDGDGCISINENAKNDKISGYVKGTFQLIGTYDFVSKAQEILGFNNKITDCKTYCICGTGGTYQVIKVLNRIYYDSTYETRLDRKYQKYLYFLLKHDEWCENNYRPLEQ